MPKDKISPKKKYNLRSSTESCSSSSSDSGNSHSSEVDTYNVHEYRKMLAQMFPSRYMSSKVQSMDTEKSNKHIKNKRRQEEDIPSESSLDEDEDEEAEEEEIPDISLDRNFNIIFTIEDPRSSRKRRDEWDESEDESYMYDESEYDDEYDYDDDMSYDSNSGSYESETRYKLKNEIITVEDDGNPKMSDEHIVELLKEQTEQLRSQAVHNKSVQTIIKTNESQIQHLEKKKRVKMEKKKRKNTEMFKKSVNEKRSMSDLRFFKEELNIEEQEKVLNELEQVNKIRNNDKPYRITLIESNISAKFKSIALKKINNLRYLEPGAGEYYKIKNWVDTFMQIPFGKFNSLPISLETGIEQCHEYMEKSKEILDNAVFGLNDAKMQVMQLVGQWITNPNAVGTALAIKGPMGTGKTTLVKEGISKILGREFAFLALGGATDSSFLEGHSYTYEGSTWGKIVDILIQCKSMNPVIYFDELDKVSDTPKGAEIIGILTHLTDIAQNSQFHDKYFAEIDFDLSKCLFIFSYNDESKVNPILKDRMYRIQTKGYKKDEKYIIANNHLLPSIREQIKFSEEDIVINNDVLSHIIDVYTEGEEGVRNLKRCLEIIFTKINLFRLMKPGTNLFNEDLSIEIKLPCILTIDIVNKLLKNGNNDKSHLSMYM